MTPYYSDDLVTLYHGDCREIMPTLEDASMGGVITSPPYNLGAMSGGYANLSGGYATYPDDLPLSEYIAWQKAILTDCWRLTAPHGAIFYNHKPRVTKGVAWLPTDVNPGLPLRQIITWVRSSGVNWSETHFLPLYEWILLFAKPLFRMDKSTSHASDVWKIHHHQGPTRPEHPAPFPMGVPIKALAALNDSGRDGAIFDPFAGSGTTLRAAKDDGRRAVGIEIDERYCEIAAKRLEQDTLFGGVA